MAAELDCKEGGGGAVKGKLSQSRGETLVEVLASVVIATLSIALLFGGIMASSTIDRSARISDKSFYQGLSGAEEAKPGTGEDWKATVSRESASRELDVKRYGGEGAYSYAREGAS